jgi:hypothetical protein
MPKPLVVALVFDRDIKLVGCDDTNATLVVGSAVDHLGYFTIVRHARAALMELPQDVLVSK